MKRSVKPDQKTQQTQLDELLAFVEECRGEPITNDNSSSQQEPREESTSQGENSIEPVNNQCSTNAFEPPSTPVRMRKSSSASEQKTPSRQTRLSARKRNSHIMESEEKDVDGYLKIARLEE